MHWLARVFSLGSNSKRVSNTGLPHKAVYLSIQSSLHPCSDPVSIISEVLIHTMPPEPVLAPSQPRSSIHSFIFAHAGSSLVHGLSLVVVSGVSPVAVGVQAPPRGCFSCCRAEALGLMGFSSCGTWAPCALQAPQLWHTVLADPQHLASSWSKGSTCVPCVSRWILNHQTTREVPHYHLEK